MAAWLSLPVVAAGLWLPVVAAGLYSPVVAAGLWLPVVAAGLSLPVVAAGLSLPVVAAGLYSPVVAAGLSLPVVAAGLWLPVVAWVVPAAPPLITLACIAFPRSIKYAAPRVNSSGSFSSASMVIRALANLSPWLSMKPDAVTAPKRFLPSAA